jgi:bifunctional DNA-binding transcriptional regulator/antitoxin component of YhaV-PrlF toxin-antitoxin module
MATVRKQTTRLDHDGPLSIPTEIREAAHLSEGDVVLVEAADGGLLIRHIDPDQAGFWTEEWLEGEREIDAEIARGAAHSAYASTQEFIAHLESVPPADKA